MKLTRVIIICTITLLALGCSQSDEFMFSNDIGKYYGIWRDTLYTDDNVYVAELIIKDDTMNYIISDANTLIICDKLDGILTMGNENKMLWNGISPFTNTLRNIYWSIFSLSPYQMRLYSDIYGEYNFRKVYYPSVYEYEVKDTLSELLTFTQFLPLFSNDLQEKFGTYNHPTSYNSMTYLLNHPIFDRVMFKGNYENDTIYSYILQVPADSWKQIEHTVNGKYAKIRSFKGTTEYCNSTNLETSSTTISMDADNKQITIALLKDYEYWPDVTHYLGMQIQDVNTELGNKYVYTYHHNSETSLDEYEYQTAGDSICYNICVRADEAGTVQSCGVTLHRQYSKKAEAQKEENLIAKLLSKRYLLHKEESDEQSNNVFYYRPYENSSNSNFEVQLKLKYRENGVSKLFSILIEFCRL